MKFSDLPKDQQQVLTAWMNGETMQYKSVVSGEWRDVTAEEEMAHCLFDRELRVKPKEPVVTYLYAAIYKSGNNSVGNYESIHSVIKASTPHSIDSFIVKTFHDGVFVKAEIIPKGELENE